MFSGVIVIGIGVQWIGQKLLINRPCNLIGRKKYSNQESNSNLFYWFEIL